MTTKEEAAKYSKESLLKSKRFKYQRDILMVILAEDKQYTLKDVEKEIKLFLNKEVK